MADDSLKNPVSVNAVGINASSLPVGFSPVFTRYLLSQAIDFSNVADKANQSGNGAYNAQARNDEQDEVLGDHDGRLEALNGRLNQDEANIATNSSNIAVNTTDIAHLSSRVTGAENGIAALQSDYVSRSRATPQSLSSSLNVSVSYSVNGLKVIGARQTGWTPATGTAYKDGFNADQSFTVSDPPTQAEVQAIAGALSLTMQRLKAIEDAQRAHGLID